MLLKKIIVVISVMGIGTVVQAKDTIEQLPKPVVVSSNYKNTLDRLVLDDQIAINAINDVYAALALKQTPVILDKLKIAQDYFTTQTEQDPKWLFTAQMLPEQLTYITMAAKEQKSAQMISTVWSDLYYLEAFTWIELEEYQKAENALNRALEFAPLNSTYLKEKGFLLMHRKAWVDALTTLKLAEAHLDFRPPQEAATLRPVILRSNGVVLIELNRLEEAKAYFKHALQINPQDQRSLQELKYIQQLEQSNANKLEVGRV